jgi:microcystin-dependent protein
MLEQKLNVLQPNGSVLGDRLKSARKDGDMAEPFLAEIMIMSFNFPPKGWALCNGALLPINQNQAIFSLLGTTFGGDGRVNFALPNLQGRVPIHVGSGHVLGERGGEVAHTLTSAEMPQHVHLLAASANAATVAVPGGNLPAAVDGTTFGSAYGAASQPVAMAALAVGTAGGSQPHDNMQPFLTLTFCIALQGIFPSPT